MGRNRRRLSTPHSRGNRGARYRPGARFTGKTLWCLLQDQRRGPGGCRSVLSAFGVHGRGLVIGPQSVQGRMRVLRRFCAMPTDVDEVDLINLISRYSEGLPHHASNLPLTPKGRSPIVRPKKRGPYHPTSFLTYLPVHYDKPVTNDELKRAIEPYGRRVCPAHDGLRLAF